MQNKKINNIIFFLVFFILFGFIGVSNSQAGIWDNYSCSEIQGTCRINSCDSGETDYNNQYARSTCGEDDVGVEHKCCYVLTGNCTGSDEKCADSQPSEYEGKSSGDQWCKIKGNGKMCWKKKATDTKCTDANGQCTSSNKCSELGTTWEVYDLGKAECQQKGKNLCCIDTQGKNECELAGGKCITGTCSGTTLDPTGCDATKKEICCKSGSSQNACEQATYSCIAKTATCSGTTKSLNCDTAEKICCDTGSSPPNHGTGIEIPSDTGLPDPAGGIKTVLSGFLNWILTIFLILALISFVITGIMYLVAMGNAHSEQIESAKNGFKYSIIAVVIVGASLLILRTIDKFLMGVL